MELLLLCWEFFKTGLFAVGGGMATIPFLIKIAERYPQWYTLDMLMDMIAVSESTPGPIGANMATYVGYHVAGVIGGVCATLALVLPSFLIMLLISRALSRYRENNLVNAVFGGLRPTVTGLIAAAGFAVLKTALFPNGAFALAETILFVLLLGLMNWKALKKIHPIAYIGAAAVAGIVFQMG